MRKCALITLAGLLVLVITLYVLGANSLSLDYFVLAWQKQPQEKTGERPVVIWEKTTPSASEVHYRDWSLIWRDEFSGSGLDDNKWTAVSRSRNYNNELQRYVPDNITLHDGKLQLTARQDSPGSFSSGMVQTMGKLSFCQGKIEARISLPTGRGLFPAFWLRSETGEDELDILEMIGNDPECIYGVSHILTPTGVTKSYGTVTVENPEQFHVYSLEWEIDELRWYVDGVLYHRSDLVSPENMYIVINLAVGGNWPGSPDESTDFPCGLAVDYIRLYQRR